MTHQIDLDKVEALAAQGLTNEQIALALGISRATHFAKKKAESDYSDAIKRGQAKGIAKVSNALFQNAVSGNTTAQIFFLKNRAPDEWKDKSEQNIQTVSVVKVGTGIERD